MKSDVFKTELDFIKDKRIKESTSIILELLPFINELTGRRPIILPVIMEVNRKED